MGIRCHRIPARVCILMAYFRHDPANAMIENTIKRLPDINQILGKASTHNMNILAATKNAHKLAEFNEILFHLDITIESAYCDYSLPTIIENGVTFEANAILKAKAVALAINKTVFADDSGLEVAALNGEPGILSARYAGEKATDMDRIHKLLDRLQNKSNRLARFVCVIAVASATGIQGTATGIVEGEIAMSPRGRQGFGYDPIFIPRGYDRTMAELSPEEKNTISHRFKALQNAYEQGLFSSF